MKKLSIVMPVYNEINELHRPMKSLYKQSFQDWELIMVDDGSTDGSAERCDEYAKADERIRVIHQANQGYSGARNTGLEAVETDYVMFVDADDFLEPDALETAYKDMTGNDVDYVIGGVNIVVYTDASRTVVNNIIPGTPEEDIIFNTVDLPTVGKFLWELSGPLFYCVWGRLFRMDIIRDYQLRFNRNIYVQEDFNFILTYYYHTRRCMASNRTFYNYCREVGKDDIGEKPVIDQHNFNEVTLINFLRMAYKFQFPKDFCTWMYAGISEQYIRLTSKIFLESTGLTEDERRHHVYKLTDNFIFRFFCEHLKDTDPYWNDMDGYLKANDLESIYHRLDKKIAEDLLPPLL